MITIGTDDLTIVDVSRYITTLSAGIRVGVACTDVGYHNCDQ
jgi:hypothetical protein